MQELLGKDIYLSSLRQGDYKKIWKLYECKIRLPYETFNLGYFETVSTALKEKQKIQGIQNVRFGIFKKDKTIIGDIVLQNIDWENKSSSIGIKITEKINQRKGYGTQAVLLMLKYGFFYLGLEYITASTLEHNYGCRKMLLKSGMKLEGAEQKAVLVNGRTYYQLNFIIQKEEFFRIHKNCTYL